MTLRASGSIPGGVMAGLSIGMRIYVTDQFVSTDTCAPVYRIFGAAARLRGVIDESLIDPNVIMLPCGAQ